MLEAKHVVKTFDGFRALDGLTMTVPTGAVYGLVGPNGAGKSTIIRHLAGIYRQDSGEVLLDGQPVYEDPAVKRRMTVIGDDWYYFPHVSSADYADGWYDKVEALQGERNTYYAGEVMSFGDMEETAEYSRDLVRRFFH